MTKKRLVAKSLQAFISLAQREGFEPSDTFLHHTISNRARSTAPPSLHSLYIIAYFMIKSNYFYFIFFIFCIKIKKRLAFFMSICYNKKVAFFSMQ